MSFQFATCSWPTAKRFLQRLYPSQNIEGERIPKLKALIEADILRIQDPDCHSPAQITTGKNFTEDNQPAVDEAVEQFKAEYHNKAVSDSVERYKEDHKF